MPSPSRAEAKLTLQLRGVARTQTRPVTERSALFAVPRAPRCRSRAPSPAPRSRLPIRPPLTAPSGRLPPGPPCTTPSNSLTGPEETGDEGVCGDARRSRSGTASWTRRPRSSTTMRSARNIASSGSWVTIRVEASVPSSRRSVSSANLLPEVLVESGKGLVEQEHPGPWERAPAATRCAAAGRPTGCADSGPRYSSRSISSEHLLAPTHRADEHRLLANPKATFSRTVKCGKERIVLEHESRLRETSGGTCCARLPPSATTTPADAERGPPASGSSPAARRSTVVLPQPEGPSRQTISPGSYREAEVAHRPTGVVAVRNLFQRRVPAWQAGLCTAHRPRTGTDFTPPPDLDAGGRHFSPIFVMRAPKCRGSGPHAGRDAEGVAVTTSKRLERVRPATTSRSAFAVGNR